MLPLLGHHYSDHYRALHQPLQQFRISPQIALHAITRALQQILNLPSKTITEHYTKLSKITALRAAITAAITDHYTAITSGFLLFPLQ
jgi:hypothetical protein